MTARNRVTIAFSVAWLTMLLALSGAVAQSGPELPCLNCPEPSEQRIRNPLPETGIWRNPEQSGTGFMLEVQRDRLAGYYYLYDEVGNPLWYAFNGELAPADDEPMWVLETELQRFQHGACLGCPYQPPELGESPGSIRLEFLHRGHARFSVDGAPYQYILPLTYGVSGSRIFEPHSDHLMPNLEGYWAVLFQAPIFGSLNGRVFGLSRVPPTSSDVVISYWMWNHDSVDDADQISGYGRIDCRASPTEGPICEARFEEDISPAYLHGRVFIMRPGDMTDSRLFAEHESSWSFEAFRVRYD